MMHNVHAPITTPASLGMDAAHHGSPACDVGEPSGTVWYTLVDFIRTVVEARAHARLSHSPSTAEDRGEGLPRSTNRVPSH